MQALENTGDARSYVQAIRESELSIYDCIGIGDPVLWIPTPDLEHLLNHAMVGISLDGLPIRTRSKVVKQHVCRTLGYPVPSSFKKTQPRFMGQCFDTYVQKSNNLQIWNEEIALSRRYAIFRVNDRDVITRVRVVTGEELAALDATGTLTKKYQAQLVTGRERVELITSEDTAVLQRFIDTTADLASAASPLENPHPGQLLPIREVFLRLSKLIGKTFPDAGYDQERNRGAALHRLVCKRLGYSSFEDDGKFPDIRHQLLEVKLQTSPTIDLGLVRPNSQEILAGTGVGDKPVRHCDVRYALFYAQTDGNEVSISHVFLTTGEKFFTRFRQFQGKEINAKLQIPLPADFFD